VKLIKLLIGGSPCTFWSITQKNNRETEAEGLGWELFENYLIAKEKFKPNFFLYENNKSAARPIKDQISRELGVDLMYINSALVSAQDRERFYAFNWEVEQPEQRGVIVKDILDYSHHDINYFERSIFTNIDSSIKQKPIRLGFINKGRQGERIYSVYGKSVNLMAMSGGLGAKTGLYLVGDKEVRKLSVTESCRLQTLPDNYCRAVSNAQAYKGLGNGWTAEVIIHILNGALKDVPKDEEIVVLSMYDGIGTGRYCLDKMGFTNVKYFAYEIDKYAKQVAMSNYPDIIQMGDAFQLRHPDWTIGY
jgi:DNA (cytosine-5)-methyltransferase 3A